MVNMQLTNKQIDQIAAIVKWHDNKENKDRLPRKSLAGETVKFVNQVQCKNGNVRFVLNIIGSEEIRTIWYSALKQPYFSEDLQIYYPTIRFIGKEETAIYSIDEYFFRNKLRGRLFLVSVNELAKYTFNRQAKKWPYLEDDETALSYMNKCIANEKIPSLAMILKYGQCFCLTETSQVDDVTDNVFKESNRFSIKESESI